MSNSHPRMTRELRTVEAMIEIFCHGGHETRDVLCGECAELRAYAQQRLERCPFQEGKTTCSKCPVHCYRPVMREQIRAVMRYSGPRMIYLHPVLALLHLKDGRREQPFRSQPAGSTPD